MRLDAFRTAAALAAALTALLTAAPSRRALAAGAEPPLATPPLDESALDRGASPCADFYQFACGGWIAKTEIPADKPGWSRGFFTVEKRNQNLLHAALDDFAAHRPGDAEQQKLADYYGTCMDEAKTETGSMTTLARRLATIGAIKDAKSLAVQIARAHLEGIDALFDFGNEQDLVDSNLMIAGADQGGLGLPDRDYYLSKDGHFPEIRQLYHKFIADMLALNGEAKDKAAKDADEIVKLETRLAKASMARVDRRDPRAVYHRLERDGLAKLAPHFAWDAYFEALGYPRVKAVNVAVPAFFAELDKVLTSTPLPVIQTYLRWHVLARAAPTLPKRFVDEQFHFSAKALTGQAELPPRWERCLGATLHAMDQAVGKVFVAKTFGPAAKADAQGVIAGVEKVMAGTLQRLDWMDQPTRDAAEAKLAKVANQIGYPDKWRSYDGLRVGRESYLANALDASVFNSRYALDKIGKPVDRKEWGMPPSMVNAYYSASNNKMVFPAGILQSPFYEQGAPAAVNFGAIGMVMGHELTHGFDDQGRKFDPAGNMRDWWSQPVGAEFEKRAACMAKQYDGYVAIDDLHINGKLTLGENIADNGGIKLAYGAWQAATGGKGETLHGFTPEQQFFLGFAQSWCTKLRPEFARMRVTTDVHSPPAARVNGPVSNFDEFAKAFSCKAGAPMAPADRCKIW